MYDIVILYEADHTARAQALQVSLTNRADAYPVDKQPVMLAGLKTIVFWGHGDEHVLCDKTPDEIYRIVRAWHKLNPKLDRVEILTCNSAHWRPFGTNKPQPKTYRRSQITHLGSSKQINNSFNKRLKRLFKYDAHGSLKKMHVWGMPYSDQSGHFGTVSILLWDQATSTWALVSGKTVKDKSEYWMNHKKFLLTMEMAPMPFIADQPWTWYDPAGTNTTGPMPQRLADAKQKLAARKANHQFTPAGSSVGGLDPQEGRNFLSVDLGDVLAGTVHDLRDALVEIN